MRRLPRGDMLREVKTADEGRPAQLQSEPTMKTFDLSKALTAAASIIAVVILLSGAAPVANAADVNGAWASNLEVCNKVFVKTAGRVAFTKNADLHGSGFIIDGNGVRGKLANCKIKTRKQDGNLVRLIASCATDVMLSDIELTLKVIDDNKIARVFEGMPELETPYYRCPQ